MTHVNRISAEESSSFLKKTTKKLLSIAGNIRLDLLSCLPDAKWQSFLLLFFRKEESLSCLNITYEGL